MHVDHARRAALKGLGLAASSFMLPDYLRATALGSSKSLEGAAKAKFLENPKWYGPEVGPVPGIPRLLTAASRIPLWLP
jgi:hypothetical protein